jgi:hypothetical protein
MKQMVNFTLHRQKILAKFINHLQDSMKHHCRNLEDDEGEVLLSNLAPNLPNLAPFFIV